MIVKIKNHFKKVDPILFSAVDKLYLLKKTTTDKYFKDLCFNIINQQLSSKAGNTIFNRFKKLYPGELIIPKQTLNIKFDDLRKAGISTSKANFIIGLAQKIENNQLKLENLNHMKDDQVIVELTKIKGIGPWTAEMFMMFSLGRDNLFSYGDVGLKNAIKKLYKFKREPTKKEVEKIVEKWSPYKTYGCIILWSTLK